MRKNVFVILALTLSTLFSFSAENQHRKKIQVVKQNDDIKSLFENGQFQEIIDLLATKKQIPSVADLIYISEAYLHLDDSANATKYADMAILKNPKYGRAYYVKGKASAMADDDDTALLYFQKASIQEPQEPDYYLAIGDAYLAQGSYDEALLNYNVAIALPKSSEKAYYMIGAVYATQNKEQEGLDAFYTAKTKIVNDKELYVTVLYNIGTVELSKKNYMKAISAYKELIDNFPDDYGSYEKLIQCYYALGQYSSRDIYKKRLYSAFKKENLGATNISDMFCVDQFTVDSKQVLAYERYEEPSEEVGDQSFEKKIFYVINETGDVDASISVEYSPDSEGDIAGVYRLFMSKGDKTYTFDRIFDKNVRYITLKPYIINIVSEKIMPIELK